MDAFWWILNEKLSKKTHFNQGRFDCNVWVGCLEHGTYGKTTVTWPDGKRTVERTHRVAFMVANKILRADMPWVDASGKKVGFSPLS